MKKNILSQNNYIKDVYSNEESEEEFEKCPQFDWESVGHKPTEESISKSCENTFSDKTVFEKTYKLKKLFNDLLNIFPKSINFPDFIHERYIQYSNQTESQK